MLKIFLYKDTILTVKTNMLKNGTCYFGEKDIQAQFEKACRESTYGKGRQTDEQILITIDRSLKNVGIKAKEIRRGILTYDGTNMTDLDKQTTIKEEETPKEI